MLFALCIMSKKYLAMHLQAGVLLLICVGVFGNFSLKNTSVFEVIIGSYTDCKESCNAKVACLDIRYDRLHKICKLYKTEIPLPSKQYPLYIKDQFLQFEQQNVTDCHECAPENCEKVDSNYSCVVTVCQTPVKLNGTILLGNSNVIGSKKRYQCAENQETSWEITCLQNGSWSNETISCENNKCALQSSLQNGHWSLERFNSTHFYANVTCNTAYDLRMPEMAVCDIDTGDWSGLELICCDIYNSEFGLKVYTQHAYVAGRTVTKWRDGSDLYSQSYGKDCSYRNASFIDSWSNFSTDVITFRVIENDTLVAYLTFNGTGSTNMDWFAKDRLIESSWRDLNKTSDTQYFGIYGNGGTVNTQRFLISESTDPNGNCWNDTVWLAVTWEKYPCGNTSNYDAPRILYAYNNTVSQFVVNEIGFADKFEVWVNQIP